MSWWGAWLRKGRVLFASLCTGHVSVFISRGRACHGGCASTRMAVFSHFDDISLWKSKLNDPNSCLSSVVSTVNMSLPPRYIGKIGQGIREVFNMDLKLYSPSLDGVLVAYEKLKRTMKCAEIIGDHPYLPISASANFIVFKPTVGSILKGIVNKISKTHIGCLVHGAFNASIPIPGNKYVNEMAVNIAINEEITFEVTGMDLASKIIFLKGQLIHTSERILDQSAMDMVDFNTPDSSSGYQTASSILSDPHAEISRKRKRLKEQCEEPEVSKKKKKHKGDPDDLDTEEFNQMCEKSGDKKKKSKSGKVKRDKFDEEREPDIKKSHKNRKKKSKDKSDSEDIATTDVKDSEKKKKKKNKDRSRDRPNESAEENPQENTHDKKSKKREGKTVKSTKRTHEENDDGGIGEESEGRKRKDRDSCKSEDAQGSETNEKKHKKKKKVKSDSDPEERKPVKKHKKKKKHKKDRIK